MRKRGSETHAEIDKTARVERNGRFCCEHIVLSACGYVFAFNNGRNLEVAAEVGNCANVSETSEDFVKNGPCGVKRPSFVVKTMGCRRLCTFCLQKLAKTRNGRGSQKL